MKKIIVSLLCLIILLNIPMRARAVGVVATTAAVGAVLSVAALAGYTMLSSSRDSVSSGLDSLVGDYISDTGAFVETTGFWSAIASGLSYRGGTLQLSRAVYDAIVAFLDWVHVDKSIDTAGVVLTDMLYVSGSGGVPIKLTTVAYNPYPYFSGYVAGDTWIDVSSCPTMQDIPILSLSNGVVLSVRINNNRTAYYTSWSDGRPSLGGGIDANTYIGLSIYNNDLQLVQARYSTGTRSYTVAFGMSLDTSPYFSGVSIGDNVVTSSFNPAAATVLNPATDDTVLIHYPQEIATSLDVAGSVVDTAISGDISVTGEVLADSVVSPDNPTIDSDYAVNGLSGVFPFCLPFDLYNFLSVWHGNREAPRWVVPLDFGEFGQYDIDIDFSDFDGLASAVRSVELGLFCVGLILATKKLLGW